MVGARYPDYPAIKPNKEKKQQTETKRDHPNTSKYELLERLLKSEASARSLCQCDLRGR